MSALHEHNASPEAADATCIERSVAQFGCRMTRRHYVVRGTSGQVHQKVVVLAQLIVRAFDHFQLPERFPHLPRLAITMPTVGASVTGLLRWQSWLAHRRS
jgi:hypothetical protein